MLVVYGQEVYNGFCIRFCFSVHLNPHSPTSASCDMGPPPQGCHMTWASPSTPVSELRFRDGTMIQTRSRCGFSEIETITGHVSFLSCRNILPQTERFKPTVYSLTVWRLEILNRGVGRATFPLKSLRKNPSTTPHGFWWLPVILGVP